MPRPSRIAPPVAALLGVLALAAPAGALDGHFEPFRGLVGKTWRGVFPGSTPEKPLVDVQRFELALNGRALRVLHSINDGEYGGETLIVWDREKQGLVFFYFTTAGFHTSGAFKSESGALVSHELVKGDAEGVTEVRATSRLLPDGRLHVKSQYLKGGRWEPGRELYYVEDPRALVRFRE
jgi:hypothetical protein